MIDIENLDQIYLLVLSGIVHQDKLQTIKKMLPKLDNENAPLTNVIIEPEVKGRKVN